ncbi:MAG TPA: class I SAM-dependent methyltransferase [Candidatus Angelobacter sp.]|nr:class I SAM-dependent methyltransferase [Candidatus Angelobacter sp.]
MPREWNSSAYQGLSDPQFSWGLKVVERLAGLPLSGHEHTLDAGCGTGRVTAVLLDRFPSMTVLAVDESANMVAEARRQLAAFGRRVQVEQLDLLDMNETESFDLVFSTAVFHWIHDRDRLFSSLYRSLRRGGYLLAQCGGGPNLKRLRDRVKALISTETFRAYFEGWREIATYSMPDEISFQMKKAGFEDVLTGLEETPVSMDSEARYRNFLDTMILHPHLERLPEDLRNQFLDHLVLQSAQDRPPWVLDYWRLNLSGRKPQSL